MLNSHQETFKPFRIEFLPIPGNCNKETPGFLGNSLSQASLIMPCIVPADA